MMKVLAYLWEEPTREKWRAFLVLLFLSVVAYLPTFFIPFLSSDEGSWGTIARETFSGGLYTAATDNKPPFHFEVFWVASLGGQSTLSIRFFIFLWSMFGSYCFWKILRNLISSHGAWIGAVLFTIYSGVINGGAYSGERVMVPFLLVAFLLAIKSRTFDDLQKLGADLLVGALYFAAIHIKPTAALVGLLIPFYILRKPKTVTHFFTTILMFGLGGIFFTSISWSLIRVPFGTIWSEAYASNFQYASKTPVSSAGILDMILDASVVMFWLYMPVIAISVFTIFRRLKEKIAAGNFFSRSCLLKSENGQILLVALIGSLAGLALGKRFYQQYFTGILPVISAITAIGLILYFERRKQVYFLLISLCVLVITHGFTTIRQITDNNRNWNSEIKALITKVKSDTRPGDYIYITSSAYSVYLETETKPASRYLLWLFVLNWADSCRAPDEVLNENQSGSNYLTHIADIKKNRPKVFFWTSKHQNNCSDRFKIENFPSIRDFLNENYDLVEQTDLGYYYRLKLKKA